MWKEKHRRTCILLGISLVAVLASLLYPGNLPVDPAWAAILLCGIPIVKGAVVGLVTELDIKADVLVSIALVAAVLIGEIFAAGEVAFIMALGAYLEDRTVAKARQGIEKLVNLTPATARVIAGGEEHIVPAEAIRKGDTLRVLAGETIAVDGVITKGRSAVDQSVMTGEPLPVDKEEGDAVFSGTINQFGAFEMTVRKVGQDSSLQRMIRLVESADAGKAKIVGMADRWATWIVVTALLAAVPTWLLTGEAIRAVTILVVFCPCALVLATPTAMMAGIGNAAQRGILIREGDALERLAQVKRIAFDKTGTLTYGRPAVACVQSCRPGQTGDDLLRLAAAAELHSGHPLGRAIVEHYKTKTGQAAGEPDTFRMLAGRGVSAHIGGQAVLAGNVALLEEAGVGLPAALRRAAAREEAEGCTVIYLAADLTAMGFIALADTLRPEAAGTIAAVHAAAVRTALLTGDAGQAANHMARTAGISDCRSHCLPEDKMEAVAAYERAGQPVCMVGDGINDAPALKAAHVGIAMGGIGSDIAIGAADIVLISDDIRQIPHLLHLAKRTMKTIHLNLSASMLLNFAAIALAVTGVLTPVLGALVHNAGSVAVIVNSSLLLHWRKGEGRDNRSHASWAKPVGASGEHRA